jgi:hypothetical protein
MTTRLPIQRLAARQFALTLKLFADCVHVGTFKNSFGTATPNVPFLFAGLPAFGIESSSLTRSDVCAYVSSAHLPASYRLAGSEVVYYWVGQADFYFTVICGAVDPTGSFWCLFLRPTVPPK